MGNHLTRFVTKVHYPFDSYGYWAGGRARAREAVERLRSASRRALLLVFLSVAAGLAACAKEAPKPAFAATDISGAAFGPALSALRTQRGEPFALADLRGRAVLVFFGYTTCPDICPTALARFADLRQRLAGDAAKLQVVFVTVDPERDDAKRLTDYLAFFDPSFIGLRGDLAATEAVAKEFKVHFAKIKGSPGLGYTMDHSSGAYLFDPAGRARLYVRDDLKPEALAGDVRRLLAGE